MFTTSPTYMYWSTADLRQALAEYNRQPLTPTVRANRAEICRELAIRTGGR